jgi:stearoyl-CoA desaturase (delta-9 desaturase)
MGIIAGASGEFAAGYDGRAPFPGSGRLPLTVGGGFRLAVTAVIVLVPFAGLAVAVRLAWGHGLGLADALLALGFYVLTGLGVSVGLHRLLTHRSFSAARPLRIALAVAGSMSFEGDVIGWVAIHRRHHAFTDRPGDPHSPYRYGTSLAGQLRGLAHAHAGWLLRDDPSPPARYAPDMLADPAMRMISRGFPVLCAVSLALPLAAGWMIGGTWHAALTAVLWPGWSASLCCSTSPGASTHCAMSSAPGPSPPAATTGLPIYGRSPWCRSVRAGTTCTTPTPPARGTAWSAGRWTSPLA